MGCIETDIYIGLVRPFEDKYQHGMYWNANRVVYKDYPNMINTNMGCIETSLLSKYDYLDVPR